jgi:hypothetical protein
MSKLKVLVCLLCLAALAAGLGLSQTTNATITGTVTDSSGAVVPNATITVTNIDTNIQVTGSSNEVGNYSLPQLKEGRYTLRVEAAGFQPFVAQDLVLTSRDIRRVDAALELGTTSTAVEVSAGATLIETETARISDTQTSDMLKSVPLNARWLWAFFNITPGYVNAGEGYRFAGARQNQTNWAIDGTTFSDGVGGGSAIGPLGNYVESFQEVKIDMANNSAEFGTVGQITVITKSGSNNLHGSAADYLHTPWFRARNPFAPARTPGVYHIYAGSVGGPVYLPKVYNGKNRTFFYTVYEGSIGGDSATLLNPTVPLESWRSGDFSSLLPGTVIYDPTTGQPFANNQIPATRINPVSKALQDRFYPLPNFGNISTLVASNYREQKMKGWDIPKYWVVRGDHRLSDRDSIFGRFTFTRGPVTPWEGNLPTIGQRIQRRDTRAGTVSWTRTINAQMVNEFRWGMNLNNNPLEGPVRGLEQASQLGLQGLAPDLPDVGGMLKVRWQGIGLAPIEQIDWTNPGYRNHNEEFQEHFSWFRGRHNLRLGFDMTRVEWDERAANDALFGALTFSSQYTGNGIANQGHPYADFLLGIPTTAARAYPPMRSDRNRWTYDLFFTDEWKINQQLTLTLGARYELHNPWRENNDYLSIFDIGSGKVVVPDGALSKVNPLYPTSFAPVIEAKDAGLPGRTLLRRDRNNIAPRVGIAYRPSGQETVIRAGYGIYFDPVPRNLTMASMPFVLREEPYTNPLQNPTVMLPRVYPDSAATKATGLSLPAAVNPDLKFPYSQQWNLTIERQQWDTGFRVSYIGTNTRQGDWAYNINSPLPDAQLFVNKTRMFPQYSSIMYYTNGANHQYHGFTAAVERRMKHGLMVQSSWTWARDIYDLTSGQAPENPFDRDRERAVSRSIPTHRMVNSYVYQLPFGKGKRWGANVSRYTDWAIGGWALSGVLTLQTGQFLTPAWSGQDPVGIAFTGSTTPASVSLRPNVLRDPNLPVDQRTPGRWFDVGAFGPPAKGHFGSAAKGIIEGPGINSWNMGLQKDFLFGERMPRVNLEITAVNMFNRPNYGNPGMNISQAASAGVITGLIGDDYRAREFRAGLRVEF